MADSTSPRHALWLPLFDALADPAVVADIAVLAEESGWDAVFVWDHVHWHAPIQAVADPTVTLAAIAARTSRVLLGPMVTPLARRRPAKVARETASLDALSDGRLVLGVGLGSDRFGGEYSRFGDETDDRTRAAMLDESLDVLARAWSGEHVRHRGAHFVVDDVAFSPTPRGGRIPVWVAAFPGNARPLRRAARHDGFFPVNLAEPAQLEAALAVIAKERTDPAAPFDVAVALPPGADPASYVAAGATWILAELDHERLRLDEVRALARSGPPR